MRKKENVEKTSEDVVVVRQKSPKKPYEKPQIIYQGALEAMAAVCLPTPPGKAIPGIGGCRVGYS